MAPSKRSLWSAVGLIFVASLSHYYYTEFFFPDLVKFCSNSDKNVNSLHIAFFWRSFNACLLLMVNIFLLVNIFKPLKCLKEVGLMYGSLCGLFGGVAVGTVLGIFLSLPVGIIDGLFLGIFSWTIVGFFTGLITGFIQELA